METNDYLLPYQYNKDGDLMGKGKLWKRKFLEHLKILISVERKVSKFKNLNKIYALPFFKNVLFCIFLVLTVLGDL